MSINEKDLKILVNEITRQHAEIKALSIEVKALRAVVAKIKKAVNAH